MQPITKVSITDQVVEHIKSSIASGEYKQGDKLPPSSKLCQQLNVGRSTIREAYRILQASGYIEVIHGRGAFIAGEGQTNKNSENWFLQHNYQLKDIWDVRSAIELKAIKLAIENMSDKEIQLLEKIQESFIQAVIHSRINQMALYDEYFHSYIIEGAHNQFLIDINSCISDSLRAYRLNSFSIASNRYNAIEPHQEIIDALYARDADRASTAVENHIKISIEDIERIVSGTTADEDQ